MLMAYAGVAPMLEAASANGLCWGGAYVGGSLC